MKDPLAMKLAVHAACLNHLEARVHEVKTGLQQLKEAGLADTKSSAGDKHETARALAQIEVEKLLDTLRYLQEMESAFLRTDPSLPATQLIPGALVRTDKGTFYISAALGKIVAGGATAWAISPQAPLLSALAKLAVGGSGEFNGRSYRLLGIH